MSGGTRWYQEGGPNTARLTVWRRALAALAFKVWCKTPRRIALHPKYLPIYGRVGWALDEWAYGHMRDEYLRLREAHRG